MISVKPLSLLYRLELVLGLRGKGFPKSVEEAKEALLESLPLGGTIFSIPARNFDGGGGGSLPGAGEGETMAEKAE